MRADAGCDGKSTRYITMATQRRSQQQHSHSSWRQIHGRWAGGCVFTDDCRAVRRYISDRQDGPWVRTYKADADGACLFLSEHPELQRSGMRAWPPAAPSAPLPGRSVGAEKYLTKFTVETRGGQAGKGVVLVAT